MPAVEKVCLKEDYGRSNKKGTFIVSSVEVVSQHAASLIDYIKEGTQRALSLNNRGSARFGADDKLAEDHPRL